ncbi:MAG: PH domain-containing protein [Verrucomicrobiota bacterium]
MNQETETPLWKGTPSQWLNMGPFCLALLLSAGIVVGGIFFPPAYAALILPLGWMIWRFLVIRCEAYELTSQRLKISKGVFNQTIDEIELYRVKDVLLERKWWMRILGLGSLHLETSDRSLPQITIPSIPDANNLRETLRREVEIVRDKKRVRELDFEDTQEEVLS